MTPTQMAQWISSFHSLREWVWPEEVLNQSADLKPTSWSLRKLRSKMLTSSYLNIAPANPSRQNKVWSTVLIICHSKKTGSWLKIISQKISERILIMNRKRAKNQQFNPTRVASIKIPDSKSLKTVRENWIRDLVWPKLTRNPTKKIFLRTWVARWPWANIRPKVGIRELAYIIRNLRLI